MSDKDHGDNDSEFIILDSNFGNRFYDTEMQPIKNKNGNGSVSQTNGNKSETDEEINDDEIFNTVQKIFCRAPDSGNIAPPNKEDIEKFTIPINDGKAKPSILMPYNHPMIYYRNGMRNDDDEENSNESSTKKIKILQSYFCVLDHDTYEDCLDKMLTDLRIIYENRFRPKTRKHVEPTSKVATE